jgi:CheY-like chemotaxis protein
LDPIETTVISSIKILHLEDDPRDAELLQATLEAEGVACHITRVEARPDFLAFLKQDGFDLILADYPPLFRWYFCPDNC